MFRMAVPVVLGALFIGGCAGTRAGYESAPYKTTRADGAYEIRDYPSLRVAATARAGDDDSFMRLFRYIEGANESREKIAMTTPVLMEAGEMRFVMPGKNRDRIPKPASEQVAVRTVPARTVAAFRFSGLKSAGNEKEAEAKLRAWVKSAGWAAAGDPFFAYYDPPWTPGWLRRNEVLLPVKKSS